MLRHYQEALGDCDFAIQVDASYDKAYLRKAQLLIMNGFLQEAIQTFDQVLKLDPKHKRAIKEKRDIETMQQKYTKALDFFQRLHNDENNDKELALRENIMEVAQDIEAVLEKCVAWNELKVLQAEALWALGQQEEAFDLTNKLVKQQGTTENTQLHSLRATIFISMGRSEDAIYHLRTVLAHDKDNERAVALFSSLREFLDRKAVADQAYKERRFDDALEQYQVAMETCPSPAYMAKLYFNRACTQASLERHDLAIMDCNESIRLNEEYIKAYMRRAASLRMMMNDKERCFGQAIRDYEVALTLCKTKQQSREIKRKLRNAKAELLELKRIEANMAKKMQQRYSTPMMVTPESSPQWVRKTASLKLVRTKTEDSCESTGMSMSISKSARSRASSASSWRSHSNSPAPLYVSDDMVMWFALKETRMNNKQCITQHSVH